MNLSNPLYNLLIFTIATVLLYFFLRPVKGWFWLLKNNLKLNEKVIIEDILKQLYTDENSGKQVTINALTRSLKFRDELIINTLKNMSVSELIRLDGDVVRLSPVGWEYALKIVRVHRLWEKYLAEKTGYDKSEWHTRAEMMEHELSHEETNRLAIQLGNPMYDPHGDPIPTLLGKMPEEKGVSLATLPVNTVGRIIHIEDEPEVIYKQILAENIHIGSWIRVMESNNERIVFYAEGEDFKLAPVVAANITVEVFEKDAIQEDDAVRLSSLKANETARILGISKECRGESRRRLLDLGFVKGTPIRIDLVSPLQNPKAYEVKGTSIALRDDQAINILIKKD
ncbi:MAG: FeoA domain-containing protein [Flavobacteriaceae bacterium]|nr:FeoA domain-containing protein [Flavobacteriaceae bacterium]